ncbi:hypothetical protein AGMMS50268_36810 [Spirochaetia bacterium]|nr:hypothetical protein AGMMS50268_36810 [Spirochaetia bacterium]
MNKNTLISVVLATFNEPPEYIAKSIQSILDQTIDDFELLLIDDSTKPDTVETINTLTQGDSRIKLIRSSERMGFVQALNIGLKQAQGKYIARMDGDDISLPNRFELQLAYLESHPDVHVIGGSINIINEKGEIISCRRFPTTSIKVKLFSIFRSPVSHPTVMMRKSIIEKGIYYDENFKKAEDLELWLRLIKYGYNITNIPDIIVSSRVIGDHSNKRTKDHFLYNYKARKKNIFFLHPIFWLISILISKIYTMLPKIIIDKIYKMENKN